MIGRIVLTAVITGLTGIVIGWWTRRRSFWCPTCGAALTCPNQTQHVKARAGQPTNYGRWE